MGLSFCIWNLKRSLWLFRLPGIFANKRQYAKTNNLSHWPERSSDSYGLIKKNKFNILMLWYLTCSLSNLNHRPSSTYRRWETMIVWERTCYDILYLLKIFIKRVLLIKVKSKIFLLAPSQLSLSKMPVNSVFLFFVS